MKPAKSISPEAEFRSRLSWFLGVSDPVAVDPETLTYEPFFGLREKPFSLAADPRFFFTQSPHGTAFNALAAGIKRREGILVLTGEVGTGKTTLCRAVLESLDRKTFAAFVSDPFLSREDLLKTLLVDFGVVSADDLRRGALRGASRAELSYPLREFLASLVPLKAFAVAIIDEAQSLSADLLDEIRVLSDLESGPKLLQVFLVGQPELEARLADASMRQLSQRVAIHTQLAPLTVAEVGLYIAHRLAVAGNDGRLRFTDPAVEAVHAASAGIPRVINLVCDRALTRAASLQTFVVDADAVTLAGSELKLATPMAPPLSLVHSQPSRPSWREIPAAGPAPEPEVPAAPPSLVNMLSGVIEPESKPAVETSPGGASTAEPAPFEPVSAAAPEPRFDRSRSVPLAAAAAALLMGLVGYAIWSARSTPPAAKASGPAIQQPPIQQPPAAAPTADAVKKPEPAPAPSAGPLVGAPATVPERVAILMATFVSDDRTQKSLQEIRDAGLTPYRVQVTLRDGSEAIAVYVGPYDDRVTAERDLARARDLPGYEGARIVAIKRSVQP